MKQIKLFTLKNILLENKLYNLTFYRYLDFLEDTFSDDTNIIDRDIDFLTIIGTLK